jgi:hypothetical protein
VIVAMGAVGALGAIPARAASDEQTLIRDAAYSKLDTRFRLGATGPDRFDCSGFVYWVFREAGLLDRIGGERRRARGYYRYFKNLGLTYRDEDKAKVGDLVFYARSGAQISHMGIITDFNRWGRPLVTSALVNPYGVTEMRYFRLNIPFVAFGAVPLDDASEPTPDPTTEPTPDPTAQATPESTPAATADEIDEWLASTAAENLLAEAMADGESDPRALLDRIIESRD